MILSGCSTSGMSKGAMCLKQNNEPLQEMDPNAEEMPELLEQLEVIEAADEGFEEMTADDGTLADLSAFGSAIENVIPENQESAQQPQPSTVPLLQTPSCFLQQVVSIVTFMHSCPSRTNIICSDIFIRSSTLHYILLWRSQKTLYFFVYSTVQHPNVPRPTVLCTSSAGPEVQPPSCSSQRVVSVFFFCFLINCYFGLDTIICSTLL